MKTKISFTSKCIIVHKKLSKYNILIVYCQFNIYVVRNKSFSLKDMKEFILEANINYELTLPSNPDSVTGYTIYQEAGLPNFYCNRQSKFIDKELSNILLETLIRGL